MLCFFRPVFKKSWIVRHRFGIPRCPLRFLNLTLIFYKCIGRICLGFAQLHCYGRNWLRLKFPLGERFWQTTFRRKQLKTQFFQRASVTLSQFSGLISREWHSKAFFCCDLRLLIEKLHESSKEKPLKGPVLMNSSIICLLKKLKWKRGFHYLIRAICSVALSQHCNVMVSE